MAYGAGEYICVNAGIGAVKYGAGESICENAGLPAPPRPAAEYFHYGDANTATPTPQVWFLQPDSARPLDAVNVIGHGFGAAQGTYSGVVQGYDGSTWQNLAVLSWNGAVAATADALTSNREIIASDIDPEHGVIGVTVPSWAVPPNLQVRVQTNGP